MKLNEMYDFLFFGVGGVGWGGVYERERERNKELIFKPLSWSTKPCVITSVYGNFLAKW